MAKYAAISTTFLSAFVYLIYNISVGNTLFKIGDEGMIKINLELSEGIPQYSCNCCGKCDSLFAKSLCAVKNRGCCWYFPKFTLYEIHKMTKSEDGLATLKRIISLPKTDIYHYYIHAKGFFDEKAYKMYMMNEYKPYSEARDRSIFFRACPFVKQGEGCTIPKQYRSYVCNFFICEEVTDKIKHKEEYNKYVEERQNFVRWIDWENYSLEMMLREKNLNLEENFNEVIAVLKDTPLEQYEFPYLPPISEHEEVKIGA